MIRQQIFWSPCLQPSAAWSQTCAFGWWLDGLLDFCIASATNTTQDRGVVAAAVPTAAQPRPRMTSRLAGRRSPHLRQSAIEACAMIHFAAHQLPTVVCMSPPVSFAMH